MNPVLQQINLVVADMTRTVAFCRCLGWQVEHPEYPHLEVTFDKGVSVEFDEVDAAATWNSHSAGVLAGSAVVVFGVADRAEVDRIWQRVTDAGYGSAQRPFDAFWGSRFAIVLDPDGNQFGLMSPRADEYRSSPPTPPPAD
jgi:predicted enzyme related to lactoylglutathione lyase